LNQLGTGEKKLNSKIMNTEEQGTEMNRIAKLISDKREALGWSYNRLSLEAFGNEINASYLSKVEKGKRGLTVDQASRILRAMNITMEYNER
jgi:ribosome-binding protein aMBF1 (putative translation factor)